MSSGPSKFGLLSLVLAVASLFPSVAYSSGPAERSIPTVCTYDLQVWNVNQRTTASTLQVRHGYDAVALSEKDKATGCTVCSEDQEEIVIPGLTPFSVCRKLAPRVRDVVNDAVKRGAVIHTIVGYHPIRSRGPLDGDGNRTELSNHSFGTAIDINPELNGLYDNCSTFGPKCHLLRGGEWHPGTPGTLTKGDAIVRSFKAAGFKWGGEIEGKQKDFMHFSPTGY